MHCKKIPLITIFLWRHNQKSIFPPFFFFFFFLQKILIRWATFWDYKVQLIELLVWLKQIQGVFVCSQENHNFWLASLHNWSIREIQIQISCRKWNSWKILAIEKLSWWENSKQKKWNSTGRFLGSDVNIRRDHWDHIWKQQGETTEVRQWNSKGRALGQTCGLL